jgi:hypothetical protein
MGLNDQTLIEWKIDFINNINDFSKPFNKLVEDKNLNPIIQNQVEPNKQLLDDTLWREQQYCHYTYTSMNTLDKFRDGFVLFRGTN